MVKHFLLESRFSHCGEVRHFCLLIVYLPLLSGHYTK